MKKFLTILLVISLILALAAAGTAGWIWFRNNHVFVGRDPYPIKATSLDLREKDISVDYYEELQGKLPACSIVWNVPFQGGKISSDSRELTVKNLSAEDIALLDYFPGLRKLTVTDTSLDYDRMAAAQAQYPECMLTYQVNLGGSKAFPLDSTELVLEAGEYTAEGLKSNLRYLPQVTTVTQKKAEVIDPELKDAYPQVEFKYTVELNGQEYGEETTQLDLSGLTADEAAAVGGKLALLPNLETVELMDGNGESSLSMADVAALQAMAPNAAFRYTFEFYGETISTTDEEVYLSKKAIGDEGLDQVRQALSLMENCSRFVLEDCKISNEALAQLREEFRGKTKVVWRVYFGDGGSCLTDREVIKAVYGLDDKNCHDLVYCEDARFCDFGHDEFLNNCDFVAGMPNLEAIILSGSPIKSLEPFRGLKKLKFLELAFCGYVKDVSPLAECESLEMLNISATKVPDISPLYDLPMKLLSAKNLPLSSEDVRAFREKNPDCWTSVQHEGVSVQPYGQGWRYDEENKYLPYYEMLRDVFDYDHPVNTTKW